MRFSACVVHALVLLSLADEAKMQQKHGSKQNQYAVLLPEPA
jgi:hypothetical protein